MSEFRLNISKDGETRTSSEHQAFIASLSRPHLPIDDLDGDGTALDTVRKRPGYRTKTVKKALKKIAVMEEWIDYITKKKEEQI